VYKKMLMPLDGSELAEIVFPYARELAGRMDVEIVLLLVSSPSANAFIPMQRAYLERTAENLGKEIKAVQKGLGTTARPKPVKVQSELAVGYAADEILKYIDEDGIDLVLMATHGYSGIKRWKIGSVAGKIMSASKVPVMLVRAGVPQEEWPIKSILVPLDGSELAESVLPHVKALAGQKGTGSVDVTLLRVCEPPTIPSYYGPELSGVPLDWGKYAEQEIVKEKEKAGEYLAGLEKRFKGKGIKVNSEVISGKPDDEIVEYANKNRFGLIVMATHGRQGISRLVYGSVAANLLQGVASPLFVVKPQ
jgi:nucleotide-binding universal stress UspA family protein